MKAIESYRARKVITALRIIQEKMKHLKMKPRVPRNHYILVAMVQPRFVFS